MPQHQHGDENDSPASSESGSCAAAHPGLPDLKHAISAAILELGGAVVPKLNWSCPVDATWASASGTRCSNADEVLLLLKASDRVAHDVDALQQLSAQLRARANSPAEPARSSGAGVEVPASLRGDGAARGCDLHAPATLVLRKHFALREGREFRCFVRGGVLRGISQRDPTRCFRQVLEEQAALRCTIERFFETRVRDAFELDDCARPSPLRMWCMNVCMMGEVTCAECACSCTQTSQTLKSASSPPCIGISAAQAFVWSGL